MEAQEVAHYVPRPFPVSGDLYFIQAASGPVKIGRAKNVAARLRELQVGCFEPLEILWFCEGRGYEEKVWHRAFCDARLKGEWFDLTNELDNAIACAISGNRWWDALTPPASFPVEDDDDVVDWHIAIHIALVAEREKAEAKLSSVQMTSRESV